MIPIQGWCWGRSSHNQHAQKGQKLLAQGSALSYYG